MIAGGFISVAISCRSCNILTGLYVALWQLSFSFLCSAYLKNLILHLIVVAGCSSSDSNSSKFSRCTCCCYTRFSSSRSS